jgi:hypothetical protein
MAKSMALPIALALAEPVASAVNISSRGPFSFRAGQAACHFPSITFVKFVSQDPPHN